MVFPVRRSIRVRNPVSAKNRGNSSARLSDSIRSTTSPIIGSFLGTMRPATNAPNSACTPNRSVVQLADIIIRTNEEISSITASCFRYRDSRNDTARRTGTIITATNATRQRSGGLSLYPEENRFDRRESAGTIYCGEQLVFNGRWRERIAGTRAACRLGGPFGGLLLNS